MKQRLGLGQSTPGMVVTVVMASVTATLTATASTLASAEEHGVETATQVLAPVVIEGRQAASHSQAAEAAHLGVLGATSLMNAPVSIQSYTEEAIQTHQARTVGEVLQNDPSVRYTTNQGHMFEHFTIRGLEVSGQSLMLNGLYGMAPKGHVPTEFLSRVEVLRGPNALLNGMAPEPNLGGSINLVTKRAESRPVTELTTSWSSDPMPRPTLMWGAGWARSSALACASILPPERARPVWRASATGASSPPSTWIIVATNGA